jgi:hypothetical protein
MKILIKEDNEEREKGSRNGWGEVFVGVGGVNKSIYEGLIEDLCIY